jgi:glycosyltransferase involved in cell wall biosynthesis
MRIALIYLGRRGSGGAISLGLGRALAQETQLAAFLSSSLETLAAWQGAQPFAVQSAPTYASSLEAAWTLAFPARLQRLARLVAGWRPDVLLFPMFHPWNAALQKALAPVPSIIFVHDPLPHPGLESWLHARFENASLAAASRCVVLSQALVPELVRRGVKPAQIAVIPHGLIQYSRPAGDGKRHPGPTLLFFGRIAAYKGLEVLLEAFSQVRARREGLRLLIAGEGSLAPYRQQLQDLAGVEVFNRWVAEDDVPRLFERADMVVLPYTSASQSGVLAIAAAFGLPVVATRVGGLPEQINDGQTGLLVAPDSPSALAQAIERLLDDPSLAARLGQALQHDFEERRSWDKVAEMLLNVISGLSQPEKQKIQA